MNELSQPSPGPVTKDKLTVVETVYHGPSFGRDAFTCVSRFSRNLETYEQVYERKHLRATEEWQRVNLGWIDHCGMLVLLNEEGRSIQRNPTEQEQARIKTKVLEVCLGLEPSPVGSWLILPGETMRAVPSDVNALYVRSRSGTAYYTVRAFPA